MGSEREGEGPVHTVYTDAFLMDVVPITNLQFKAFLKDCPQWQKDAEIKRTLNPYYLYFWRQDLIFPKGKRDHPAVSMNWESAAAYCNWRSRNEGLQECYDSDFTCDFAANGYRLRVPYSLLDATSFGYYDLRRYNVIVLPPAGGSLRAILADNKDALASWVRGGGTLVACGSAATQLANESLGMTSVRLRRSVLDDLDSYARVVERERSSRVITVDEAALWGDAEPSESEESESATSNGGSGKTPTREEDAWMRRFAPAGVFLRGEVAPHEWLTSGISTDEMPVPVRGSSVMLAKPPARTAVRLGAQNDLRLSGLLWPEAAERLAESAYVTVERRGQGQVILFANQPAFRGYFDATARLFANAVIYGPGAGANQPIGW